jgi:glycosyltransferase involved in cell wall biosynthesis
VIHLTATPSIAVVGDRVDGMGRTDGQDCMDRVEGDGTPWPATDMASLRQSLDVTGGYLERLPLACIKAGLVDQAEIWHFHMSGPGHFERETPLLARRSFRITDAGAPRASDDLLWFIAEFGAPHLLLVLGLGVDRRIMDACAASTRIYNSIDAPALRVPDHVAETFDLVLTAAQWQSDEVTARHPGKPTSIMPIGPEFAATDLFRPLGLDKEYDVIYVAAAQPYKRHDILFAALAKLPRSIRTLCVFGYGELADDLRQQAARDGLDITFVGPPGVSHAEVNALMNRSRIGVVCGIDDGAPAILTEYMLAGLPVLANAELSCGRQFILPETGALATAGNFADGIMQLLQNADSLSPRTAALERWTWPHTVARFAADLDYARRRKAG